MYKQTYSDKCQAIEDDKKYKSSKPKRVDSFGTKQVTNDDDWGLFKRTVSPQERGL